jgi:capsular polysaccharide biosynthesis protein
VNAKAARVRRAAVASLLVAVAVGVASFLQTPKYEASAQVRVDQKQGPQQTNLAVSGEMILTDPKGLQALIGGMVNTTDSRPLAEETLRRLGLRMERAELLDNLTVEQVENTSLIVLSYKGTDPVQAKQIANTVGKVSSELISERSVAGSKLRATVYEDAIVPTTPVSPKPLRGGLITLVVGLALSAALMAGRGVLRP